MIDVNFRTQAGAESVGEAMLQKFNLRYRVLHVRTHATEISYSVEVKDPSDPDDGINLSARGLTEHEILMAFNGACLAVKFLEVATASGLSPKVIHPEMSAESVAQLPTPDKFVQHERLGEKLSGLKPNLG